jgi:hypothetical protein
MQYIQEFSIKQGVGGSLTGLNLNFFCALSGKGGRSVPEFAGFWIRKKEVLRGVLRGCGGLGTGFFPDENFLRTW